MGHSLSFPETSESQDFASGSVNESLLLQQLTQLLQQRERQTLLLSDLTALLPAALRQRAREQGGLSSWIQRYPSLFSVIGAPGKEAVTLWFGVTMQNPPSSKPTLPTSGATAESFAAAEQASMDEDSGVQLRGLPYSATCEDIVAFLGVHSSNLAETNGVQLVRNRDGRPSGFARLQFQSPESARNCVTNLHLRSMDDRYVEVFLLSERPMKGKGRRGLLEENGNNSSEAVIDLAGVTKDSVVQECRSQMAHSSTRTQLLSMLGAALSPGARAYLKQMDQQGLKHFLEQFPNEFSVDGAKGCEHVTYTPTRLSLSDAIGGFDTVVDVKPVSHIAALAPVDELPQVASPRPSASMNLCASPDRTTGALASGARGMKTPSDWGTPSVVPWQRPPAPWLPSWPQGAPPAQPEHAAPLSAPLSAWPVPDVQVGWPGFNGCPPWSGFPAQLDALQMGGRSWGNGHLDAVPNTTMAFGTAPAEMSAPMPTQPPPQIPDEPPAAAPSAPKALAAVRLRGLPFTSGDQDVLAFFAQHDIVDLVADGPKPVTIMTRANGRPSGQAMVQMREVADAELAQKVLHGQWMGSRYIEVFPVMAEDNDKAPPVTPPKNTTAKDAAPFSLGASVPAPMPAPVPAMPAQMTAPQPPVAQPPSFNGQFSVMTPSYPPWQMNAWSTDMSACMPGPGSPSSWSTDAGSSAAASPDTSSWQDLFKFLNPESAAAMSMGIAPAPVDFPGATLPAIRFGLPGGAPMQAVQADGQLRSAPIAAAV